MSRLLEINNLTVTYGAIEAVKNVSLHVDEGEIITIIGGNGAGKSTCFKAIIGLVKPNVGDVVYRGKSITGWPPYRIAALGVGLVPEGRRLFPTMTVMENLQLGAHLRNDRKNLPADMERVFALFPRLAERKKQFAYTLSGGEQQMLAIARTLMANVRLLMLDEPSLGLAPVLIQHIAEAIAEIGRREGVGVVLVEQNARMALSVADRAYVLEAGKLAMEGSAKEVAASETVRNVYLGI